MKNKYHYVYRITNTQMNKHYYGIRSSKVEPKLDLGIKYFSSSGDKDFIKEQKENKTIFKYKIIKQFNSRDEAVKLEIKLHSRFDVGINESFYNRAKQTSTGFDRSGIPTLHKITNETHWINSKTEEEIKTIYEKVSYKNKIIRYEQIDKYGHWTENKPMDEVREIYAKSGEAQKKTKSTPEFKEKLKSSQKLLDANIKRSEAQKGDKNNNAKCFVIYDNIGNIIAKGKGNYLEICKSIGMVPTAFMRYKNNPDGMYSDVSSRQAINLIKKSGGDRFVGYKISWDIEFLPEI